MYQISSTLYLQVLNLLVGHIDNKGYYSGSFELDFDDIRCRMTLSAVIYRSKDIDAEYGKILSPYGGSSIQKQPTAMARRY